MMKAKLGRMAVVTGSLVVGWCVGVGVGVASAQEEAGPLAGPGIKVREVPGVMGSFGAGDAGRFGARDRSLPLPAFFEAIGSLESEEAGEGLALSAEQLEYVRAEVRTFREELAAFAKGSGDEVRALVGQLPQHERGRAAGEVRRLERMGQMLDRLEQSEGFLRAERRSSGERNGRELGRKPGRSEAREDGFSLRFHGRSRGVDTKPGEMMEPMEEMTGMGDGQMARVRLVELHALAPSQGELETRVWEMLTEPQREHVGAVLDAYMAEVQTRREEQRLAKDIERRKGAARDRASNDRTPSERKQNDTVQDKRGLGLDDAAMDRVLLELDSGVIPPQVWSRLPERMKHRLESLPEKEQARVLARFLKSRRGGTGEKPVRKRPG